MVTMGVFPFQGKTHMVEPEIETGTSWLVVRTSDYQAARLVLFIVIIGGILLLFIYTTRLASNEIFSPSNKIYREVGRAKDLSAPL